MSRWLIPLILLSGCAGFQEFASGATESAKEVAPEVLQDLATGDWLGALITFGTATVAGGLAYVFGKKRERKRLSVPPPTITNVGT